MKGLLSKSYFLPGGPKVWLLSLGSRKFWSLLTCTGSFWTVKGKEGGIEPSIYSFFFYRDLKYS